MKRYTPSGTWVVSEENGQVVVCTDGGLMGVALVAIIPREFTAHRQIANLIAAAPDLYAAADEAMLAIEDAFITEGATVMEQAALITLRAALAKARGETP